MRFRACKWIARLCLLLFLLGQAASAQGDLPDLPYLPASPGGESFRVQARLPYPEQPAGSQTLVEIDFSCMPEHYVWHDSIKVELAPTDGITPGRLLLDAPKEKYDPLAGGEVKYLDGAFTARLELNIARDAAPGDRDLELVISYTGCGPDICTFPRHRASVRLAVLPAGTPAAPHVEAAAASPAPTLPPPSPVETRPTPTADAGADAGVLTGRSPLVAILIAFLVGLGLTFTPCVYPLIPVTISLVGATSGRGKLDGLVRSLVYVFGIAVTYSVVGVVAAATGGVFGAWLQHPAVYVALAVIFVALAGGMFDLYSIDVSSQRLQRLQVGLRGRWGLFGIWVVGLLSGAVATACIAPIILSVLTYVAQQGNVVLGFLMFFALAWGMGAPLVALGTFTGLARAMPKSGRWMVTVKHVFGVALLAVAVYFLGKSRLLPTPWFRALVGAMLLGGGVFAGAFDVLTPESGWQARLRKAAALLLLVGAGAAFLLAGKATLGDLAGPPETHAMEWLDDEGEALAMAKAQGKPVLLDYWAEWCTPCHKMFAITFTDERVVAESRRFVCAKIEVGGADDPGAGPPARRSKPPGIPSVVLISTTGERASAVGYIGPDDMLSLMRAVH